MLFAHSIDWLLINRSNDFQNEWNIKYRSLPLFSKILPLLDQPNTKLIIFALFSMLMFLSNLFFK